MIRAPELHPLLQADNPSLATLKNRAIHHLAEVANTITELMTLVRNLTDVREPDKWAVQYPLDEWFRLIEAGRYKDARLFLINHGRSS